MKAYYCIGGPLDGEYATNADFDRGYPTLGVVPGMYSHLASKYFAYNGASRYKNGCSSVFIHEDLLRSPINPKHR